jgi:hypothetical protein
LDADTKAAIATLTGKPVTLDVAKPQLPKMGGLYAWWIVGAALPGVPANKHPLETDLDLLYVGIAPNGPASSATLRSRVVGNHMNGNIAASTLRRTLASLLINVLDLEPTKKGTNVVLPKDQNVRLSTWQKTHLRLTWFATPQPWLLEATVISTLRPPLNLEENETHPFYKTLSDARRALKQSAR